MLRVARIMEQRMGVYDLAAIMACMGLKLRGNAEKEKKIKVVGGNQKITIPSQNRLVHT